MLRLLKCSRHREETITSRRQQDSPTYSGRCQTAGPNTAATRWRGTRKITPALPARKPGLSAAPARTITLACYRDKHYID
jgi:hypothetical protein